MTTQHSNAIQRRNAILRALGLVFIVMLFTGFTVSLFPSAGNTDYLGNRSSLLKMKEERDNLLKTLSELEQKYAAISELDAKWESAAAAGTGAALKRKIDPLEGDMSAIVDSLNKIQGNDLVAHSANTYNYLLVARDVIWKLRGQYRDVPPPSDPGKSEIVLLRQEARAVANDLDAEARLLEDAKVKGLITNGKDVREKLDKVIGRLRGYAGRLRSI